MGAGGGGEMAGGQLNWSRTRQEVSQGRGRMLHQQGRLGPCGQEGRSGALSDALSSVLEEAPSGASGAASFLSSDTVKMVP